MAKTPFFKRSISFAAAAAGDYAAGDVLSESATNNAGVAFEVDIGGRAILEEATYRVSEDAAVHTVALHFFSSQPLAAEVEMDDNVAFDIKTAAGAAKYLGAVTLAESVDLGVATAFAEATNLNKHMESAAGLKSIWVVVVSTDAETAESAGMVVDIDLYFE